MIEVGQKAMKSKNIFIMKCKNSEENDIWINKYSRFHGPRQELFSSVLISCAELYYLID